MPAHHLVAPSTREMALADVYMKCATRTSPLLLFLPRDSRVIGRCGADRDGTLPLSACVDPRATAHGKRPLVTDGVLMVMRRTSVVGAGSA